MAKQLQLFSTPAPSSKNIRELVKAQLLDFTHYQNARESKRSAKNAKRRADAARERRRQRRANKVEARGGVDC